jgi:pimeloyl-ACP methyl ester carboxylesterase
MGRGLLACVVVLASAAGAAQSPLQPCTIAGQPARCGAIAVPEDDEAPARRELALRTIVLTSRAAGVRPDPIVILAGGPGQAATSLVEWAAGTFRAVRETRDIVLVDQRGTGGEQALTCMRAPGTFVVPADADRCVARLSKIAALAAYGTSAFVEDLERVRKALGYDRVALYAASYGTRAAYAYARRYPQRVTAAILVAPAPMPSSILDTYEEDGRRSLDAIVADCAADNRCARVFPRLRDDVDRFRAAKQSSSRTIGLQFLQYSTATAVRIPQLLTRAAAGDAAPLDAVIAGFREQLSEQLALGAHLTIMCAEDFPLAKARSSPLYEQYATACAKWPAAKVPADFTRGTRVAVPALILVGAWDPVTSERLARQVADQFSRPQVVVLPRTGHLLGGAEPCAAHMIETFLHSGTADRTCVDRITRPPYVLR